MESTVLKYALQNAVKHKGRAHAGAVIGGVLSEKPGFKKNMGKLQVIAKETVEKVNRMPPNKQLEQLKELAPELLEKKHKEKDIFAFLGIKNGERVVTAFPPGPEKYPHIGHAKAIFLNYMLARQYDGRFILRFEDTNPGLVKKEFYDIMLENFRWLGIKWDRLLYASDFMELFYSHAARLIKKGKAYMCTCPAEKIRQSRMNKRACSCRDKGPGDNLEQWNNLSRLKEGEAVLRLKIDPMHKNSTMRDPTVFRIVDGEHARQKKKYRVWPNYDFQNAIMDGETKVTHRLRSKEFEMRNELQRYIQAELGYNITKIYEFARFSMKGTLASGRVIRERIEKKELVGWDDPSLTTIVALRRRGFLPEAIKGFVLSTGISKAESTMTWDDLIAQNKRLLDDSCDRYFFVENPVEIKVEDAPEVISRHKKHPEHPERGFRELKSTGRFYITQADFKSLKNNRLYRLMDCLNFIKKGNNLVFDSLDYKRFKDRGDKIMHYLPVQKDLVHVDVMMPDKSVRKGLAEPLVKDIGEGSIIQFERFGFCRLDSREEMLFWFTHH